MQTIPIFIVFVASLGVVALIWAIVIAVFIHNVIVAVKNRGKGEDEMTTAPTTTPTNTPTIAGMPAGVYYATYTPQMTNTFNHTTTIILH